MSNVPQSPDAIRLTHVIELRQQRQPAAGSAFGRMLDMLDLLLREEPLARQAAVNAEAAEQQQPPFSSPDYSMDVYNHARQTADYYRQLQQQLSTLRFNVRNVAHSPAASEQHLMVATVEQSERWTAERDRRIAELLARYDVATLPTPK